MKQRCWFHELPGAGRCDGSLVRCHLIPKQVLKREFPKGAFWVNGQWAREYPQPAHTGEVRIMARSLHALLNDRRVWVWGCGGAMGLSGHHGQVDGLSLRVSRYSLPQALEEYAEELGLGWWLDRRYGPLSAPQPTP